MGALQGMTSPLSSFLRHFLESQGGALEDWENCAIPGDGSKRHFWRLTSHSTHQSFIAMENTPENSALWRENRAYLKIGNHLCSKGLPIPKIHVFDLDHGWFILEDFGTESLQDLSIQHGYPLDLYEKVIDVLFRLQTEGIEGFDPGWTCQTEVYDRLVMSQYEACYFRDSFLHRYLGLKTSWPELEGPFERLQEKASRAPNHFFLHRDFQSRNILVKEAKVGIIDWQGGRLGPLAYDLASLINDPYTAIPDETKVHLYLSYLALLKEKFPQWADSFEASYPYLAIQRNLQILGAFSHLSQAVGKTYFESYIPEAARSLRHLLRTLGDSALMPLLQLMETIHVSAEGSKR